MKRCLLLFSIVFSFASIQLSCAQNAPAETLAARNESTARWTIPPTPATLSFAGEKVPLEQWGVKEQFEREWLYIYYQQSSNLHVIRLANRYFPLIEERLKANGIPDDFKYLCIAESHLQNLISKAGAVGFWQFMRTTSPAYGIKVNAQVDERYNVLKSTEAACRYLKAAYNRFGSWTAAAASYNCGMGGYGSYSTAQKTTNYYNLHLPEETNKYIYRILSFKYLLQNAASFGYEIPAAQLYQPYSAKTMTITQSVNWVSFAKEHGTTYRALRMLNPWIRSYSLTVSSGDKYVVTLP